MATSIFIKPTIYHDLTESQIYEWRKDTYNNLGSKRLYSLDELKQFDIIQPIAIDDLLEEISDQIKEAKILGKLTYQKDLLIYIDSSSMCQMTIPTMINKIFLKYPELKYSNLIIIFSHISKAENMYKFVNNYNAVKYRKLSFNLDLLTKKIEFTKKNVLILTTNLLLDNKFLMAEEVSYLQKFNKWKDLNIKNEINDNAQINIMIEILSYFKKNNNDNKKSGIILSHDKLMCSKIHSFMKSINNLYCLESQDFK